MSIAALKLVETMTWVTGFAPFCEEIAKAESRVWLFYDEPRKTKGKICRDTRRAIHARDGSICRYCGTQNVEFVLDHVVPKSKGGRTSKSNLVVSCWSCNSKKSSKTLPEWGWFS